MLDATPLEPGLIRLTVTGTVTEDDIKTAIALLERERAGGRKLSIIADLRGFESFTIEALWADTHYGITHLDTLKDYERIAVITSKGWIARVVAIENALLRSVEMRSFGVDETDAAATFARTGQDTRPEPVVESGIERLASWRPDVLAMRLKGHITSEDGEALTAIINGLYEKHDRLDLLLVVDDYKGFDWSILTSSDMWRMKTASLSRVRRYALVVPDGMLQRLSTWIAAVTPVTVRTFKPHEQEAARAWLDEGAA